ncbi:MAG: hypothetical protein HRU35_01005 [Rickettsiaceae bacterium]|nr:hypothetical protein [Rickettsiaceae bacterium]
MEKMYQTRRIYLLLIYSALIIFLSLIVTDALAFNIDQGVKAATDPLLKGIKDHWGKAVAISGVTTAIVSDGDMRTRAVRAGIGCGASGAVVMAVLGFFT